jgi:predicted ribosomally synthesized peptide with SipW-like signal peptide
MSDEHIELTRRKVLAGVGAVGAAGAGAGVGTSALFSDDESFTNNVVEAGTLDLVVDYVTSSHQGSFGSSSQRGEVDGDGATEYSYRVTDVKPGDSGTLAFCPKVVDNPGWLWVGSPGGVTDYENGQTEPEAAVDDTDGGSLDNGTNDGAGAGELSEAMEVTVSYAESVSLDSETDEITCHDARELNNPPGYSLADLAKDLRTGFRLDGNEPNDADGSADAYPGSSGADDQQGPCICIEWSVPADVGNEIQSDAVEMGFTFAAVQRRNNPSPTSPFVDHVVGSGGDADYSSIQAAIDGSGDGDVILVRSGTYEDPLDVQGASGTAIVGESGATIRPTSTLEWGSETNFPGRTTGVRVVNSTDVLLRNLTFDFEQIDESAVSGLLFWESEGIVCESTLENMSSPGVVDITSYLGTNDPGSSTFSDADRARVEFLNNEFVETGRIGINAEDFVGLVVDNNTFTTTDAGYAVEVGSEATGVVRNNVISGYNTDFNAQSASAGIYVENAYPASGVSLVKGVVVDNNEVYDSTVGIRVGNEWHSITGDVDIEAVLTNNYVHDNVDHGISITDSGAEDGSSVTVTGHNNTVENNGNGYYVFEDNSTSEEDDARITVDVERDAISSNDIGVLVESASPSPVDSFQSVAVTDSNIENNAADGVRNTVGDLTVDATRNWWNASDGPNGAGPGSGDGVSSNVGFAPFASSPAPNAGD